MSNTPSHLNEQDEPSVTVKAGLIRLLPAFTTVAIFSFFINLLMFVSPLYMLQIYDRVMVSHSELTLLAVSALALMMFCAMALAEWGRSRLLVATGIRFDERLSTRVFDASFDARLSSLHAPGYQPGKACDSSSRETASLPFLIFLGCPSTSA